MKTAMLKPPPAPAPRQRLAHPPTTLIPLRLLGGATTDTASDHSLNLNRSRSEEIPARARRRLPKNIAFHSVLSTLRLP